MWVGWLVRVGWFGLVRVGSVDFIDSRSTCCCLSILGTTVGAQFQLEDLLPRPAIDEIGDGRRVYDGVVTMMRVHRGSALQSALQAGDRQLAMRAVQMLYNEVSVRPQTTTLETLQNSHGIVTNGSFHPGMEESLVIALTQTGAPKLLKILNTNSSEYTRYGALPLADLNAIRHLLSHERLTDVWYLMDLYPTTLEGFHQLHSGEICNKLWEHISEALDGMHNLGLVHGDVKPANIFIGASEFVLGDLGSTVRMGTAGRMIQTTLVYVPIDYNVEADADPLLDWWMLAVVFYERVCLTLETGVGTRSWQRVLKRTIVNGLLGKLQMTDVIQLLLMKLGYQL